MEAKCRWFLYVPHKATEVRPSVLVCLHASGNEVKYNEGSYITDHLGQTQQTKMQKFSGLDSGEL